MLCEKRDGGCHFPFVFVVAIAIAISSLRSMGIANKPELGFDFLAVFFTVVAAALTGTSFRLVVLQMQQVEELRSADLALADEHRSKLAEAMSELAKELRRRPEVSSSVTFALFAAPKNRVKTESPIDDQGSGSV